jgi:hypothetical protein
VHVNRQVRDEAATRLNDVGGLAAVSTNQGWNLRVDLLPAAIVGTRTDTVEDGTKQWSADVDRTELRTIELTVEIVADGEKETLDDDMDALRADVEAALGADVDFGGLAGRVQHTGGELVLGTDEEGNRWFAFLVLTWEIEVWTEAGNPEVAL